VNIAGSGGYLGGLAAENGGTISQCCSTGSVSGGGTRTEWWCVGGLAADNAGTVIQCYSTAAVSGNSGVGGLVGYNGRRVICCYSTGPVSGRYEVGGLIGTTSSVFWVSVGTSFWDIQTSGKTDSSGGVGKTTAEMQTARTYLTATGRWTPSGTDGGGWDFVGETANGTKDIWWILEGKDYPRFAWECWAATSFPASGALDVVRTPTLRWSVAPRAAAQDVYFGEDENAVAHATPVSLGVYRGRLPAKTITYEPGALEWAKTYYWRIDEVNEADPNSPWKGNVWSFTTADFVVVRIVDDYESYTDDFMAGQAVCETWIDARGWYIDASHPGNGSGSTVGNLEAPICELMIVHGGKQSMPMDYNNVNKPWYSEAERTWATAQDWTIEGADTLTLYFRGEPNNSPEPLYVGIEDSAGQIAVVVHPDPNAVLATEWQKWHIPLGDVRAAGVDVTAVKKMVIGVGDRKNPKPGGTGRIYIDDIRLTKRMP